ncbi:hypothetical protein JSE7799_01818 [Jannaschia seosinensis]|uniref:DUF3489 domain-containing protein n=1 Tax=Jannaschia seosinensis TaxID=313367 RepID=A0A0M7BAL2_9RHOB|nr:DUF3489 domain-containing protein [Jannaschia seosinensis]CUH39098.1 hypothetical protein JSE7799_01818 [Jannaschia seosinensis]
MPRPRQTKSETVRSLLARPQGANLEAICKATGWQPHSARAALSGFRKTGYTIERETPQGRKAGGSIYRITAMPGATE